MNHEDDVVREAWQTASEASRYRARRGPARYSRYYKEEAIARSWLEGLPSKARILDVPCGTGRFIEMITTGGFGYFGADVSLAMIREALRGVQREPVLHFVVGDAAKLPFTGDSFDCVIIWRLLHHIGRESLRRTMLSEAARVARHRVLVSFYHAFSFTAVRRGIERALVGRGDPHAMTHWRLEREAASCGLRLLQTRSFCKYVSINWFACFEKVPARRAP